MTGTGSGITGCQSARQNRAMAAIIMQAGNTVVPALLALETLGFEVSLEDGWSLPLRRTAASLR
jgi:hypothetical protein